MDSSVVAAVSIGLLPVIGSIIAIATPIIKLNSTISVLSEKIDTLIEDKNELSARLKIVEDTINILSKNQEIYYREMLALSKKINDYEYDSDYQLRLGERKY